MITQAVVLVGGKGERLKDSLRFCPAVEVPKPLIEVGGKPFITYSLNMLKGIGFTDIVLLVGYKAEVFFEYFREDKGTRLVPTQDDINQAVLSISLLHPLFVLLNGDCFPIMDWRAFCSLDSPTVAMKIVDRDAGVAIVSKSDVEKGVVSCSDIAKMALIYNHYTILGGLHIGTPQGLNRARQFMDIVVYGQ